MTTQALTWQKSAQAVQLEQKEEIPWDWQNSRVKPVLYLLERARRTGKGKKKKKPDSSTSMIWIIKIAGVAGDSWHGSLSKWYLNCNMDLPTDLPLPHWGSNNNRKGLAERKSAGIITWPAGNIVIYIHIYIYVYIKPARNETSTGEQLPQSNSSQCKSKEQE